MLVAVGDQYLSWWEFSLPSFVKRVVLQLGVMSIVGGDASGVSIDMNF